MLEKNLTDSLTIIEEILLESPHLSGVYELDSIEAPKVNTMKAYPCSVFSISSSDIREVQFDEHANKGNISVLIDVRVRIGNASIELHIDEGAPLYKKGAEELSVELQNMFAFFGFDLSKMVSSEDVIYIARPIDGVDFITWANETFLSIEEARRFSMLIIDSILKAEEKR